MATMEATRRTKRWKSKPFGGRDTTNAAVGDVVDEGEDDSIAGSVSLLLLLLSSFHSVGSISRSAVVCVNIIYSGHHEQTSVMLTKVSSGSKASTRSDSV